MKNSIWETPMRISRKPATKTFVWIPYEQKDENMLFLLVTLRITGALWLPGQSDLEHKEEDYKTTYQNALEIAELFWRKAPHRSFVVMYRKETEYTPEGIYVYQLLTYEIRERGV